MLQYKYKYSGTSFERNEMLDEDWLEKCAPHRYCTPVNELWDNAPRDNHDRNIDGLLRRVKNLEILDKESEYFEEH